MTKLFTLLFLLPIIVCGQTTATEWKTIDEPAYSVQYPSTWEANQSGQMGTSFVLLSPLESEKDMFRENVNLLIQDLTGKNIDLDKYTAISENQIKTMAAGSNLIESKRIKNGTEYQKVIYTADQGTFHLKFEQFYWMVGSKAYVLTFTAELSKFDSFKETGERILNSFKLKK